MQLHRFDLNLLIALDALLREKNVTRAAERVYVTQPSMSGALQRLREHFEDQLLVRVGRDMELTPKAQSLIKPVREILLLTQYALAVEPTFDPATARRKFTLMMSDYCNLVLMPALVRRVAREAPDVQFRIEHLSPTIYARLDAGDVDLCVLPDDVRLFGPSNIESTVHRAELFTDRWTCAVAADHPTVRDSLSVEQYFELPHVAANFGGETITLEQFTLHRHWRDVKVEAMAPGFVGMLFMLPGTELVATVQTRLAKVLARSIEIRTCEPPVAIPELHEMLVWHERSQLDPGHAWLRTVCMEVARSL